MPICIKGYCDICNEHSNQIVHCDMCGQCVCPRCAALAVIDSGERMPPRPMCSAECIIDYWDMRRRAVSEAHRAAALHGRYDGRIRSIKLIGSIYGST